MNRRTNDFPVPHKHETEDTCSGGPQQPIEAHVALIVGVAALGYFVDVFDLVLFNVVRTSSLRDLGISGEGLLSVGAQLLHAQLFGLLIGGILWGVLGDRVGRIQALFGSILLYSLANIANGFVQNVEQYELLRFISGVGLAGEVGGAITLVGETLSKERRGVGTTIVAAAGAAGAACAGILGDILPWRTMYFLGGALGLLLLGLRVAISESTTFQRVKNDRTVARGNLALLVCNRSRLTRLLALISIGLPFIFASQYLATFSPEIATTMLRGESVTSRLPIVLFAIGITLGDVACGALSQVLRSRKKAMAIFLAGSVASFVGLLYLHGSDKTIFVAWFFPVGFFSGLWAVLITTSAELFGTNLRATAATMVPNLVRGVAIPIGWLFLQLKGSSGIEMAVVGTTSVVFVLAVAGLLIIRESFTLSLEYVETKGGQASYRKTAMAACVAAIAILSTPRLSAADNRSPDVHPSPSSRLKIGVSVPLTGVASSYGTDIANALTFANSRIANDRYELIVQDDRCDGKTAVSVAKKLVEVDNVTAIIGYTCSASILPAAPYLEQKKVVAIAALAGAPRISEAGEFVFRTIQSDARGAALIFERALTRGGKLGIITDQNEWNVGIQEALLAKQKDSTLTIVVKEQSSDNLDYRTQLHQMAASGANSIFLNVVSEAALLAALRQLRATTFTGEVYSFYHPASNTFRKNLDDASLPPLYYIDNVPPQEMLTPEGKRIVSDFEAQYGKVKGVPIAVVSAMEAMRAIHEAIEREGYDGEKIRNYLSTASFHGVFGPWRFDSKGDIVGLDVQLVPFVR